MSERSDLHGSVAIVTGASRGIGLAIATELLGRGAKVCITARKAGPLADAARALGSPDSVISVAGNTDSSEHRGECVEATMAAFGRIDLLVNNSGTNPTYGPMTETSSAASSKVFDVNVTSALEWVKLVHAAWMGEHGGSIVNISSAAGIRPALGIGIYGASKAALSQLTAQLAWELAPGIRVNAVAPAVVQTVFAEALYVGRESTVASAYPLGRLGTPQDIASAVAFLLSSEASWITGQTLVIDGGLGLTGGIE